VAPTDAAGTSFTDTTATPGDYSYVLRWRPDGVQTDVSCSPASVTVPEGGGGIVCAVGLDANGDPTLSWTDLGLSVYVVREANLGFVSVVNDATTFTDVDRAAGDYSYVLRYRQNGVSTDLACTPSPITVADPGAGPAVNTCNVAVDANGVVTVNWSAIEDENSYVVRDNDGFVFTVNNALSYVDTAAPSGERTYVIRSRHAGVTTDVVCNPDPVVVP